MKALLRELETQRWDDHRYYHHDRINQSLHLVSAISFLVSYAMLFKDPAVAAMIAWLVAMTTRQAGHFFFEPRTYDYVNHATHEHKEDIKVGYNLQRKRIFLAIWAAAPALLLVDPTLFGLLPRVTSLSGAIHDVGMIWLVIGVGGLLFRTIHLFFIKDVATGLVWMTKILTDPFHDIKLYHKSPVLLFKGRRAPLLHDALDVDGEIEAHSA